MSDLSVIISLIGNVFLNKIDVDLRERKSADSFFILVQ